MELELPMSMCAALGTGYYLSPARCMFATRARNGCRRGQVVALLWAAYPTHVDIDTKDAATKIDALPLGSQMRLL